MKLQEDEAGNQPVRYAAVLILGAALLRILAIRSYAYDSDETQHLHVAWGWSRGFVQYRDLFDNHTPLFHMATAPLLRLTGERPESLDVMRLAMLPLALATLALVWFLADRLYSRNAAWLSAALLAWFPLFFFKTTEFRNDQPWLLCWTLAIALLSSGPVTLLGAFTAGIVMGAAFAFSAKSVIFVATIVFAALFTRFLVPEGKRWSDWRIWGAFASGAVIVPALVVEYFAARGALTPFLYCVITFNTGVRIALLRRVIAILLLPPGLFLSALILRRFAASQKEHAAERTFLLATSLIFVVLSISTWPILYPRVFLPALPALAVLAGEALLRLRDRAFPRTVMAVVFAAEILLVTLSPAMWKFDSIQVKQTIADTLSVTNPNDPVLDRKGETVFRPRALYQVMETIALQKIRDGRLRDDLIPSVIEHRCMVAVPDSRFFPLRDREFLNENFLPLRSIRVAGTAFSALTATPATFHITIPSTYAIVESDGHPADGILDGSHLTAARFLTAGTHVFVPREPSGRFAAVWARVLERHIPFTVPESVR